jgi:hypothetical protein
VHAFPSSQTALVRHCHTPPTFVQLYVTPPQLTVWHSVWVAASQVKVPPPPQVPVAPAAPHPLHVAASVIVFRPHDSPPPQLPDTVEHPEAGVQTAVQQPPAVQVVWAGVHEQPPQLPDPSQYCVHCDP